MKRTALAVAAPIVCGIAMQTAVAQTDADTAELPTVVVTGEQPGPGLWKVTSGDHVLWILGTLSPLPKNMHWQAREVEEAIASAQEVLDPPHIKVDANVGFFGKLAPAAVAGRRARQSRSRDAAAGRAGRSLRALDRARRRNISAPAAAATSKRGGRSSPRSSCGTRPSRRPG